MGRAVVGVNAQVSLALSTVARPRNVVPLEIRRTSPLVRAAEIVPLRVGVVSLVVVPEVSVPWKIPTLSAIALTTTVVAGARVSIL